MDHIGADRVSPMHIPTSGLAEVVLIEYMVFAVNGYQSFRIVYPYVFCDEILSRRTFRLYSSPESADKVSSFSDA